MLILSRKEHQSITIGENIHIIISSIEGNNVRVGVDAPHEIKVLRDELIVYDGKREAYSPIC